MKLALSSILVLTFAVLIQATTVSAKTPSARSAGPTDVVRNFYSWYIKSKYPEASTHRAKFRQYVTEACLRKNKAARDYVYFTQAQDEDPSWGTHIATSVRSTTSRKTVVMVTLGKPSFQNKLKIELVKEGGVWKINDVANANPNT